MAAKKNENGGHKRFDAPHSDAPHSEDEVRATLRSILEGFDNAMFVTRELTGGMRSRPMRIVNCDDDFNMLFVTSELSGKLMEIDADPHVNIAIQGGGQFVSLAGTAVSVDSPALIKEHWNEAWRVWFPHGKDDPSIVMIGVEISEAEYWDNSGLNGLKYLVQAGQALLQGEAVNVSDRSQHGSVQNQ